MFVVFGKQNESIENNKIVSCICWESWAESEMLGNP